MEPGLGHEFYRKLYSDSSAAPPLPGLDGLPPPPDDDDLVMAGGAVPMMPPMGAPVAEAIEDYPFAHEPPLPPPVGPPPPPAGAVEAAGLDEEFVAAGHAAPVEEPARPAGGRRERRKWVPAPFGLGQVELDLEDCVTSAYCECVSFRLWDVGLLRVAGNQILGQAFLSFDVLCCIRAFL